jgi:hypothetical protein
MRIFVLTATYELRVSRKSHLRDHPNTWPSKCHTSSLFSVFLTVDLLGKPKTRVENKFEDFFIPYIQYTCTCTQWCTK